MGFYSEYAIHDDEIRSPQQRCYGNINYISMYLRVFRSIPTYAEVYSIDDHDIQLQSN